jgi:predicted TIM-barrel fold metal-dependent hydrolase
MAVLTRRTALGGLAGSVLGGGLAGGCRSPIDPVNPDDPKLTDPATPFTADVHTHVFNAVDVQTALIFEKVLEHDHPELQVFGPLLGDLGNFAPSVKDENEALNGLEAAANSRNHGIVQAAARRLRKDRFQEAQRRLVAAYNNVYGPAAARYRMRGLASPADEVRFEAAKARLKYNIDLLAGSSDFETFRTKHRAELRATALARAGAAPGVGGTVDGAFAFMVRDFSYRYASVHEYLEEYSAGPNRKIDLMVTTYIDYDWPLGTEKSPPCSLAEQMALAERISRLTRGWVHSNVPFCPFKQVAFNRGLTAENPIALVKDAVLNHGHIGVKFYPPMGFKPLDNESLRIGFWDDSPLVDKLKRPSLGRDLDDALRALYDFCGTNDVPLMAHTSPTMVTLDKYKTEVLDPSFWANVTAYKAGLRINFAHFGNTDILTANGGDANARGLMALMTAGAGSPGERLYADSAYLADMLSNSGGMETEFAKLLARPPAPGRAPLAERLMYGTDWDMMVIEGKATAGYLDDFQAMFDRLAVKPGLDPGHDLVNRFFGLNAIEYLGLRPGQRTRQRLDDFHRGRPQPAWMAKVGADTPRA